MTVCRICNSKDEQNSFFVREMMFGTGTKFQYFECRSCGVIQLYEEVSNISSYYPEDYYSFENTADYRSNLRKYLSVERDKYVSRGRGFIGLFVNLLKPDYTLRFMRKIDKGSKILDVGCGSGNFVLRLSQCGFYNVKGIDPYLKLSDVNESSLIERSELKDIKSDWDVMIYNHSFEHIPDPFQELKLVKDRLNRNGLCIIRIPYADSFAWEKYKENWVQLDAPRHFYIYSRKGFEVLAEKAGFSIERIEFDSTEFQFWGSEQFVRDISLNSEKSYAVNKHNAIFSPSEIKKFRIKAKELNKTRRGDQVIIFLRKKDLHA